MPLPTRRPGEQKDEFIARCIPVALKEFPDEAQAAAVCYSQLEMSKEEFFTWDECMTKMESEGYSEEVSKRICGSIKSR